VQIGKGRLRREGADVALVGYGAMVSACLTAADMLAQQGVSATVVDARFCKPLDAELLRQVPPGCPCLMVPAASILRSGLPWLA
jgi:1-deoxy-D-xylulose-5-phosphate synthase